MIIALISAVFVCMRCWFLSKQNQSKLKVQKLIRTEDEGYYLNETNITKLIL